ncbi:MAG: hypothetical protein IT379_31320, partial [Deltaproteobacteria bacterium]|nr:hypothetical protein [Deltaproteobacteria bacterium]
MLVRARDLARHASAACRLALLALALLTLMTSCRCATGEGPRASRDAQGTSRPNGPDTAASTCACRDRLAPLPFGPIADARGPARARTGPSRPLTSVLETEPLHLLPMLRPDLSAFRVVGHSILEPLLRVDAATGRLEPVLAERWEATDGGRVLTFHLRHGVRFHDGRPLTSADVRFTFDRLLDPTVQAASQRSDFERLNRVETPDDHTVVLRFREPHFLVYQNLDKLFILPRHVYGVGDLNTHAALRSPVGTGPFRFVRWVAGERIEVARFAGYWGTPARAPRLVHRIVTDSNAAFDLALRGDVDVVTRLLPEHVERIERGEQRDRLRLVPTPASGYSFLTYNLRTPALADPRIRRAIGHFLDRDAIHCALDRCLSRAARSPFLAGHALDVERPEPRFDPAAGTRLLDQTGARDSDGDGIRDLGVHPLRFTLLVPSTSRSLHRQVELLQQRLRAVGVRMDIRPAEWGALLTRLSEHDYEAAALQWSIDPETDLYPLFHSSQIEGGQNYGSVRDADVDRLLEEARRTLDAERRNGLLRQLLARLDAIAPYTYLASTFRVAVVRRDVSGLVAEPWGFRPWTLSQGHPSDVRAGDA